MSKKMRFWLIPVIIVACSFGEFSAQSYMNIHQSNGTLLQLPLNTIDSITYTITNTGASAILNTSDVTSITINSAISGGEISYDGGTPVTHRGICWGTNSNPTTSNDTYNNGSGIGPYTSYLLNLQDNTTYYVRAYAINSAGVTYGNELIFTTSESGLTFTFSAGSGVAFDGYNYASVVYGNGQEWMAENLRTSVYRNGDIIPNVSDGSQWSAASSGAWAYFNNDSQLENPYGKLYNWYAVSDPRSVCPMGWHVPSEDDWTILSDYLGYALYCGGKMKVEGTDYWIPPNNGATNESGFNAYPGGYRTSGEGGGFSSLGFSGAWWTSTFVDNSARTKSLNTNNIHLEPGVISLGDGVSIRCVKD